MKSKEDAMRACEPRQSGRLRLHEFDIFFEDFGDAGAPPVLLLPSWQIAPSRHWKMQIAHLARSRRVITFDPPGIGGGERTLDTRAFEADRVVDYAIGLLDHLGIERTDVLGFSLGGGFGLWLAARFPERVNRLVVISSTVPGMRLTDNPAFWERKERYEGWDKRNGHYWLAHYDDWLDFFFNHAANEPHSVKLIEDLIGWAQETTPEILIKSVANLALMPALTLDDVLARIDCPVLVIHGSGDEISSIDTARLLVERRPDFHFVTIEGGSHVIHARQAVRVNQEIDAFLGAAQPQRRSWRPPRQRQPPRALFISSPIGLGHVQRDLAIARELRRLVPGLEIDWLAQHPVTQVLEQAGEHIHPLSRLLASESAHWEQAASEHRLHCFYAFREMDEILLANFMVFLEAVRDTTYDLWIGDEAWEVDYFLHENPELKTAPYVFLTDFLGWLPIDRAAGSREAWLTADANADMLEQVERQPRLRDRALYIGDYDDLTPERFGPDLPFIPDWAREHFEAVGYVAPFDPAELADRHALRARLGYDPNQPLIFVSAGGTMVGRKLLRMTADAWPLVSREQPDARCIVVAGPRLDPASLPHQERLETRGYIHNLYEHLAACDLAVVQGGLSTTMELTLNRRPFVYAPLREHCEQVYHVAHRLDRYGAGRRITLDDSDTETLAAAMLETLNADTSGYLSHQPGAAGRAAARIAELL
jgi:pimeloyl-ACP methyl ester carboxylesterase/UDP:flavonoid glycosyltransferase YjiC (YdhE family)